MEGGGCIMSNVENRVVRMTFDNAQFERNVKTTMNTLTDFEKKLKLNGATAGFENLKKATDKLNISAIGDKAAKEASRVSGASSDASRSIQSIDKAANSVDFSPIGKSAYNAANSVNDAALSTDLSPINQSIDEASRGFNALEEVARGVLFNIGGEIEQFAMKGLDTLKHGLLDPIIEGFGEYETQIGSIQTIMANTGLDFDSDDDIKAVNEALDELNTYADQTIYKFTDMTQAIGTFTAAGLDLDKAVSAVKGVSNVAAFSGASASDVHRVLPQIAQALSAGTVSLQDWKSVETANMASRGFVEAIADMAIHMASVNKASAAAAEAGQALLDKQVTIRQALNKSDYAEWEDWFTSDVLSEALSAFTYDLRSATSDEEKIMRDHLKELGYQEDEMEAVFKRATMATRAATEVRTWTQLWDTVGEAIGSNWAGIWRNLIGDFKQSTDTFTFLSNTMSKGVDGLLGGIVNAAKNFNKSGAIDLIFGGFKRYTKEDFEKGIIDDESLIDQKVVDETTGELVRIRGALDAFIEAISKPLSAIKDAFDTVFFIDDDQLSVKLVEIAMKFTNFMESLIISDNAAIGLTNVFEGLFSILKVGLVVVGDVISIFFEFVDTIRSFLDPAIDIAIVAFGQVGRIIMWVVDRFMEIHDAVLYLLEPIGDMIDFVQALIRELFGFADIPGKLIDVNDAFLNILTTLWAIVDIPGKIRFVGDALRAVFSVIGDLTGWNSAVEESNKLFSETGEHVSALHIWFERLLSNPVIAFFKGIADSAFQLLSPLREIYDNLTGVTTLGENTETVVVLDDMKNTITSILGPLSSLVQLLVGGLGLGVMTIFNLISGFVEFGKKVGEAFIAWEPIQNIINKLTEFKDNVINGFMSFPDQFSKISAGTSGPLGLMVAMFEGATTRIEGVANYFSNVTVEQFVEDVKNKFNEIKDFFVNFDFVSAIQESFGNAQQWITTDFSNGLDNAAKTIESFFPFLQDSISSRVPSLTGVLSDGLKGIRDFFVGFAEAVQTARDNSDSLPEFFSNLFETAKTAVGVKLQEIYDAVSNFDLIGAINTVINGTRNAIINGFALITGVLSGLPGIFGNFFGGIHDFFEGLKSEAEINAKEIPGQISTMASDIQKGADGAVKGMSNVWKPFDIKSIPDFMGNLIKKFKDYWSGKLDEFFDFIHTIPDRFLDFIEYIKKVIDTGIFDSINGVIQKVLIDGLALALINMFKGFGKLSSAAGTYLKSKAKQNTAEAFKSIAESIVMIAGTVALLSLIPDPWKGVLALSGAMGVLVVMQVISSFLSEHFSKGADFLLKSAASVAVFAGGLLILMYAVEKLTAFDFEANKKGLLAAGGCLLVLGLISALLSRIAGNGGKNFLSVAAGVVVMSAGILVLIPAIQGLSDVVKDLSGQDTAKLAGALLAIGGFMAILGFVLSKIGESHPIATAIGLTIIAAAVGMIANAVNSMVKDDMGPVALASGILLGFLAAIYKITNDVKPSKLLASAVALIAFSGSLAVISMSLDTLAKNNWKSLAAAGAALGALLLAVYEITKNLKAGDLVSTSGALLVFGLSIGVLSLSLGQLSQMDPAGLIVAALALDSLVAVFGGLAKLTNGMDLNATATALVMFGASVGELTISLFVLTTLNIPAIWSSVGAITALIAVFGGLATLTNGLDLAATATSLLIFGGSVAELALSLGLLSTLDIAAVWSSVGAIAALIAVFGILATLTLGADLVATGAALMEFGTTVMMIAGSIWILVDALNNIPSEDRMYEIGRAITAGLGKGIVDGFQDVFDAVVNLVKHIVDTFLSLFGIHSPSLVMQEQVGQFIPEGIAQGILGNEGSVSDAVGGIFEGIKTKAQEFLTNLPEWFQTTALPFLQQTVTDFVTWFQNDGWPQIKQMASDAWNWIETVGWPALKDTLGKFWNWLSTEGWPAFCDWVKNTAWPAITNFFAGVGKWFETDGWPMIKQAAKDFWNWLSTEGWPAFCNWIQNTVWPAIKDIAKKFWEWLTTVALPKLGEFLKSLPGKLWNWVKTDGVRMVGDALKGLMDKAAEIKDHIIEWAKGIPGHIAEGLGRVKDRILEKGSEIASGIAEGLVKGITEFPSKVAQFGSNVVEAIKNFFGIHSPSKLMQDEVGVYLSQGVAEGILGAIPDTTNAMTTLGNSVMAAAQSSMGDLSQFGSIDTPTISPVLDMSSYNSGMSQVRDFSNTNSITGTLDLTSNRLNQGLQSNQRGITALGDGIVEVGDGIVEVSDDVVELDGSMNEISGYLGKTNDSIKVMDNNVVSMSNQTASATANMTDAVVSNLQTINKSIKDVGNSVDSIDRNLSAFWNKYQWLSGCIEDIQLYTYKTYTDLQEGKLNMYVDSGELVGAIASDMDQALGYRQVGTQRGMY